MSSLRATLAHPTLRDLSVLAAFFTAVHGLLLLDNAARWDGWVHYYWIVDRGWSDLFAWGRETAIPPFAYLHYFVGHLPHFVFWFKFITFISLLTATLVTYQLLGDMPGLGRADRLIVCMLIATFPANLVNLEIVMMAYAVWYACFFVAAALYRRSVRSHGAASLMTRLAGLGLFYLSFMMQSLLVFYAAFLLYAWLSWPGKVEPAIASARLRLFVRRHADFIGLPLLYWGVKLLWFQPFGHYVGYNALHSDLRTLIGGWPAALYGGFLVPLMRGVEGIGQLPIVALVVLAAVLLLRPLWPSAQLQGQGRLFVVGCGLVFVGLLPYVVVGKYPWPAALSQADVWSTRFAYLVPPGAALLVYGGLKWYLSFLRVPRDVTMAAASVVVAGFAAANVLNYFAFGIDGLRQEALVLQFRNHREIAAAATVVVEDSATSLSAYDRFVRFYEYSAMLKQAFGDGRRLGIAASQYEDRVFMEQVSRGWGYDGGGPVVRVRIRSEAGNRDLRKVYLGALYLGLLGRTEQRDGFLLRRLVSLEVLQPWR